MQTFLSVLKVFLAVAGGWFVVILWFLLLNVGKNPLNELMINIGIIPLMRHSNNIGVVLNVSHLLFMIQSMLVFSSGGFLAALIAKDSELIASLILSFVVVLICIIWDSNINCRVYYALDLFIWSFGALSIMISGLIVQRKRLIKYILHRLIKGSSVDPVKKTIQQPVNTLDKQKKR